LCGPCSSLWLRWLDYTLPPPPIVLCSPGRTVGEIQASQERRYQEWRDTVRFHQDLITRQCGQGHHYQPAEETRPKQPACRHPGRPATRAPAIDSQEQETPTAGMTSCEPRR